MDPHDTPSQFSHGVPTQPTSRRRFLKAAVVGGAAVAAGAASGAAGIALASKGSPVPRILTSFSPGGPLSGRQQYTMCITSSSYVKTSQFDVHSDGTEHNPGTLFVWLTAHDLPPSPTVGYVLDITMDVTSADPTSSSTPFQLQSSGNNAFLFRLGDWAASDCPTSSPGTPKRSAKTEAGLYLDSHGNPSPYTFGGTVHQDLQQYVHIVWSGGTLTSDHSYTFSGTVKDGNGTVLASLPSAVKITAHPV